MSIQAYDADMVEPPGIEALAAAGVGNLWRSLGGIWPLWSLLTFVYAISVAVLQSQGVPVVGGGLSGGLTSGVLAASAGSSLAAGLVTGIAVRTFLYREGAWKPDLGLIAYATIVAVLGTLPTALATVATAQVHAGGQASLRGDAGMTAGGLVVGLAVLWAALRLTLWPISALVGDADMGPGKSWQLMRGAVLRFVLAVILLSAPVFILQLVVVMLMQPQGPLLGQLAATPLNSLMALLAAAVGAEIYRLRVRLQPSAPVVEDEGED